MGDLVHMSGRNETEIFLAMLWPGGLPPGTSLCLWTLQNKTTHWCTLSEAPRLVADLSQRLDVYIGVGVGAIPVSELGRGRPRLKSAEVTHFPGRVLDLDIAGVGHKGEGLFDSLEDCAAFLDSLKDKPTLTVCSGGGVQAWWLFEKPVHIAEIGQKAFEALSKDWYDRMQQAAQEFGGRNLDAVWDLARVMRIPGSWNYKAAEPRAVELMEHAGRRFVFQGLTGSKTEEVRRSVGPIGSQPLLEPLKFEAEGFTMREDAEPPAAKFNGLMEMEAKFRLSWHRERKGLKDPKNASDNDMVLANYAAQYEWSEQEIVNLLIAHRRFHGDSLKLRADYYRKTLNKAFAKRRELVALEELDEAMSSAGPKPDREKLLAVIKKQTGVPLTRLVMTGDHKPVFSVHLEDGRSVAVGSDGKLMSYDTWQGLAFVYGEVVHRPKAPVWLKTLKAMQFVLEFEKSEESAETALFMGWVRKRLTGATKFATEPPGKTEFVTQIDSGAAFVRGDRLFLTLADLTDQVRLIERRSLAESDVLRLLRLCKFESEQIQIWHDGKNVTRRYWSIFTERVENYDS